MLFYNLGKSVKDITDNDVKNIIVAYQKLGLSCVSHLYDMLSLDTIKKESSSPNYGYSHEITPDPFGYPDNKLIFTTKNGNSTIQIVPNAEDKIISQEELYEVFSNVFKIK